MAEDIQGQLYKQLSEKYDFGDETAFRNALRSKEGAKYIYDTATQGGYDLGDYNSFENSLGFNKPAARKVEKVVQPKEQTQTEGPVAVESPQTQTSGGKRAVVPVVEIGTPTVEVEDNGVKKSPEAFLAGTEAPQQTRPKGIPDYTKAPAYPSVNESWAYTKTASIIDYNNPLEKGAMQARKYGELLTSGEANAIRNNTNWDDLARQSKALQEKYKGGGVDTSSTQYMHDAQLLAEIHNRMVNIELGVNGSVSKGERQYRLYADEMRRKGKYFSFYDGLLQNGTDLRHWNPFMALTDKVMARREADRKAGKNYPDNYYYHMALKDGEFRQKVHEYALALAKQTGMEWGEAKTWAAGHSDRFDEQFKESRAKEFADSPWYSVTSALMDNSIADVVKSVYNTYDLIKGQPLRTEGVNDLLQRSMKYAGEGKNVTRGVLSFIPEAVTLMPVTGVAATKTVDALSKIITFTPRAMKVATGGLSFMGYEMAKTALGAISRGEDINWAEMAGNSAKGFILGGGGALISEGVAGIAPRVNSTAANYAIQGAGKVAETGLFASTEMAMAYLGNDKETTWTSSLLNNGALIISMAIGHGIGHGFGFKSRISTDTIEKVRKAGYNTLANEMAKHTQAVERGAMPKGYSQAAISEMQVMQQNMGRNGLSWSDYAEVLKPTNSMMTKPGTNSIEKVKDGKGYRIVSYDVNGVEIERSKVYNEAAIDKKFAKRQREVEKKREEANVKSFDIMRESTINAKAARAVADALNQEDGKSVYNTDGTVNEAFDGITADDILNAYEVLSEKPAEQLSESEVRLVSMFKQQAEQIGAGLLDSQGVKRTICERYGISEEAFDAAWKADAKDRKGKEAEACAAYNTAISRDYSVTAGIETARGAVDGVEATIKGRVETNAEGLPLDPNQKVYYELADGVTRVTTAEHVIIEPQAEDPGALGDRIANDNLTKLINEKTEEVRANFAEVPTEDLEDSLNALRNAIKYEGDEDGSKRLLSIALTKEIESRRAAESDAMRAEWNGMTHGEKVQHFVDKKFSGRTQEEREELTRYYTEHPSEFDDVLSYDGTHSAEISALVDSMGLTDSKEWSNKYKEYKEDEESFRKDFKEKFGVEPTERPYGFEQKESEIATPRSTDEPPIELDENGTVVGGDATQEPPIELDGEGKVINTEQGAAPVAESSLVDVVGVPEEYREDWQRYWEQNPPKDAIDILLDRMDVMDETQRAEMRKSYEENPEFFQKEWDEWNSGISIADVERALGLEPTVREEVRVDEVQEQKEPTPTNEPVAEKPAVEPIEAPKPENKMQPAEVGTKHNKGLVDFLKNIGTLSVYKSADQTQVIGLDNPLEAKALAKNMLNMFKSAKDKGDLRDRMRARDWHPTVDNLTEIYRWFEAYKRGEISDREVEALFDSSVRREILKEAEGEKTEGVAKPSQPTETPQPENAMQPVEAPKPENEMQPVKVEGTEEEAAPPAAETDNATEERNRKIDELLDFMGIEGEEREGYREGYISNPEALDEDYNDYLAEKQKEETEEAPKDEEPPKEEPTTEGSAEPRIVDNLDEAMPMLDDGEPNVELATPRRTRHYLYEESGLEAKDATDKVDYEIKKAKDAAKKAEKSEPKMSDKGIDGNIGKLKKAKQEWNDKKAAADAKLEYWNEVKRQEQETTTQEEIQSEGSIPNENGITDDFFAQSDGEQPPLSLKQEGENGKETVAKDVREHLEQNVGKELTDRIEDVAKRMGVEVRLTDMNVNGVMSSGVLYIGKKLDPDKTAIFVAGHEFTHEMQYRAEGKGSDVYGIFKDAALEWAKNHPEEGGKGYNFDYLKGLYERFFKDKFKRDALGRGMSEAEAEAYAEKRAREKVTDDYVNDEIAANVAGRMLENPAVAEEMFKLREAETPQERRTRLQRILDWIKEYISKRIGNKQPEELTSEEQKLLELRDKFNDMYNEVVREDLDTQGVETSENGDARRYSVRFLTDEEQREDIIKGLMEHTGRSREDVEKWLDSENSLASMILSDPETLDYMPDPRDPAIKKNSDYPQGTVDFSNICRKRKDFTNVYTILQKENPNRVFTALDLEEIRQAMKEDGYTVACGLCFVEDRRQLLGEIAEDFINRLQNNDLKPASQKKLGDDTYVPTIAELITPEGSKKLAEEHPTVWEAFRAHNNARGQQAGRLYEGYNEYKREILDWNDAKVKKVNDVGGLRIFSFSDFEAPQLLDIIQIIQDCGARGVKIQGYTKVPEFAKAVKDTGIKLNQSLIPKGDGVKVVDGKEVLDFDPVEGIDVNDKNFVNDPDNPNVGTILVGINDKQIRLAMQDPFVDYIIPFHSGLRAEVRQKKGIGDWVNYKMQQREYDPNTGKAAEEVNIYTDVLQAAEAEGNPITNKGEFVEKFLKVCKERGVKPRFWNFLDTDANGNYIYTEGYHKFLVDFKLFDKEGNIIPQEVVKPVFDDAFNKEILDKYAEDSKVDADYSDVLGKIRGRLGIEERRKTRAEEMAENAVEGSKASQEEKEEQHIRYSLVEDPEEIERLDKEPKEVGYRNVVLNEDGTLGSPMANRLGKTGVERRPTTPFEFNRWERSDENPDLANEKGKIDLIKPDGKPVNSVDYNPYIHIRPTTVNKQFKQAWERDNLVYIKTEYPASELNGGYQAEKAAKPVGKHPWGGGELILSRWDKPVEIVPWEEVANEWVKEFKDRGVEFDIVPPKLLPILMERGVEILPPHKGMGKACNDAYREKVLNKGEAQYSLKEETTKREELRDSEESKKLFDATKKKFGTTNDFREAGYILPDGTMLDFSGRHWVDEGNDTSHLSGRRSVDHRAIYEVGYDKEENKTGFETDMADFVGRGAIRIDSNAGTINLSMAPTKEQARVLQQLIARNGGDVTVDFGDGYNNEHYAEYEGARATRVLGDIDRFFGEGIKPEGNIRYALGEEEQQSDLATRLRERMRQRMERSRSAQGGGEPPVEPPTPPAPATSEPAPELPPTGYDRPMSPIEIAQEAAIKVVADTKASLEQRNAARKELTSSLRELMKAVRQMKTDVKEDEISKKLYDLEDSFEAGEIPENEYKIKKAEYLAQVQPGAAVKGAMDAQSDYDRTTVENVVSLCKMMVQSGLIDRRYISNLTPLFTKLKDSTGKEDLTSTVNGIMDVMLKSQERSIRNELNTLLNTKAQRINQSGVVTQGGVDIRGQRTLQSLSENFGKSVEDVDRRIRQLEDMRGRIPEKSVERLNDVDDKIQGALLAKQYIETAKNHEDNITAAEEELAEIKAQYKDGELGLKEYTEQKHTLEAQIRSYRMSHADAMWDYVNTMRGIVAEGRSRAKDFIEAQKAHKNEIRHNAYSDMAGTPQYTQSSPDRLAKISNNSISKAISASLYTFDEMLRTLGRKHANGEGYLYERFGRGWLDARDREIIDYWADREELDKKVNEIFGPKRVLGIEYDRTFAGLIDDIRKMPKMDVPYKDGGDIVNHTLDQAQLMYIYMVNKMEDGIVKLRRMGISEEDVETIKNFMNPKLVELADWLQDDFLPSRREGYNEVHRRMFGTDMDMVENYVPLRIDKGNLAETVDINNGQNEPSLASTVTGGIIKRTHNTNPIDIMGTNAIDMILGHLDEMNHWKNFAEWNRDVNTLLSDKTFRNKVKNTTTIYGSGDVLWKRLKDVFFIAGGTYKPQGGDFDKAIVGIAKNVSAAKVSMRVFTATKQLLSLPVFAANCNVGYMVKNMAKPAGSWNWCMENLPSFKHRWSSRIAGDTRLEDTDIDWQYTHKKWVEKASKWGLSPNAFVDAMTVAVGARSVYEQRYKRYRKDGYDDVAADRRARQDATVAFNQTQQSSEKMFVAPMQVDRGGFAVGASLFRSASMGYERQLVAGVRNLKHLMGKERVVDEDGNVSTVSYKEASIDFMTKQMTRNGIPETQAKANAERIYRRSKWRNALKVVMFSNVAQFAWNIGGKLPYMAAMAYLVGSNWKDDDKRKAALGNMWDTTKEAAIHALACGWFEGLPFGNVVSDGVNNEINKENFFKYNPDLLPIFGDIEDVGNHFDGKNKLRGATDLVNLGAQIFIGVNPQTFTDAITGIVDSCFDADKKDEVSFGTAKEALLLTMRVMQVPQSQLDQLYIDELKMSAREAQNLTPEQLARRYAYMKAHREAPALWWMYNQEKQDELIKDYEKNFNKKLNKDVKKAGGTPEDYHDLSESATTEKETLKYRSKEIDALSAQGPEALMKAWEKERDKGAAADYKYMKSLMTRYQKDVYGKGKTPTDEDEAELYQETHGEDIKEQAQKIGRDLGFGAQDSFFQMSQYKAQHTSAKDPAMKKLSDNSGGFRYSEKGKFFDINDYQIKKPVKDAAKRANVEKVVKENRELLKRNYRNGWRMARIKALYKDIEAEIAEGKEGFERDKVKKNFEEILYILEDERRDAAQWEKDHPTVKFTKRKETY